MKQTCIYCLEIVPVVLHDPELQLADVFGFACVKCRVEEVANMLSNCVANS